MKTRQIKVECMGDPKCGKYQIRLKGKWVKEAIAAQYVFVEVKNGEIILRPIQKRIG